MVFGPERDNVRGRRVRIRDTQNMIALLISLELMLNSADLNFIVFNRFLYPGSMEGMVFTLFAIAIAAAETAIAIAIIVNIYRSIGSTEVDSVDKLKD